MRDAAGPDRMLSTGSRAWYDPGQPSKRLNLAAAEARPPAPVPAAPDPRLHLCEKPGCGKFGPYGHHELSGERVGEHWFCLEHRPAGSKVGG